MRIFVVLPGAEGGMYTAEDARRRADVARSYATATTQIEVGYPADSGFGRPDGGGAFAMARNHIAVAERMVQAEKEGYDACIPFGMVDFGVELARSRCDIPIVGQARATYAMAALMADRFGCIFYNTDDNARHWRQAQEYGVAGRIVGFGGAEMTRTEMPKRRPQLFDRFVSEGKRLVKAGAELIVCHGMSMSPVEFTAPELAQGIGVPVLEGMGCAVAMAEAWTSMGTPTSRIRYRP